MDYSQGRGRPATIGNRALTSGERSKRRLERLAARETAAGTMREELEGMHHELVAAGVPDRAADLAKILRKCALKAVAEYTRGTSMFFVQDGPKSSDPRDTAQHENRIVALADKIGSLASAEDPDYLEFEAILRQLHALGFFPDASLVSDVARAFTLDDDRPDPKDDFISEDDLLTFEGFLKYQAVDFAASTPEELAMWRGFFDEATRLRESSPKVGLMKLRPAPGEQKYAVAIRRETGLWLTMWIRCSPKGEVFIMYPRNGGNPHASFREGEHLGIYYGHGTSTGAVCNPKAFDGVVIVEPGVLGPKHGSVGVDLVEPEYEATWDRDIGSRFYLGRVHQRQVFPRNGRPSVVITIQH